MNGYSLYDVFLMVGLFQGLIIILSLQIIDRKNKAANKMLIFLLLIAAIMLLGRVALFKITLASIWRFAIFVDVIIFLIGPIYYMYVRRLLLAEKEIFTLSWIHFIPAGLHVTLFVSIMKYDLLTYKELFETGQLFWQFLTIETTGLISYMSYLFASKKLIQSYVSRVRDESATNSIAPLYLKILTGLLLGIGFLWFCSILITYVFNTYLSYFNYSVLWFCVPFVMYLVGYFGLKHPMIFKISVKKVIEKRLKNNEVEVLKERLEFFMNQEKLYIQPDVTRNVLAQKMNTSSNNVSWLLNHVYQVSFYEYINDLRIKAFIKSIEQGNHKSMTLLAIAFDVGFNSKSTFNKVFKEQLGTTPSNYVKEYVA